MPNQIIINMDEIYPFDAKYMPESQNKQILVRKLLLTANKQNLLNRMKFFQKLKIPNTIKLNSIFQNSQSIEIYYEYVGIKFEKWMKTMSVELQKNLKTQLQAISLNLAKNKISTKFNPEHIGLDKDYHIKYFIDFQKAIYDPHFNPRQLKKRFDQDLWKFLVSLQQIQGKLDLKQQKIISLQLKLKMEVQKSPHSQIQRNMKKQYSVKTLHSKLNLNSVPTQASLNQVQVDNYESKPNQKTSNVSLNQKLNKIKQKLQFVKQKSAKMNSFFIDAKFSTKNQQIPTKNQLQQKQPKCNQKRLKTVSYSNQVQNQQEEQKSQKYKNKPFPQYQRQNSQKAMSIVFEEDKKIKSQKFKTPKNSESPIEYLDIIRSPSAYVLDFLNVLEDSSESENSQNQEQGLAKQQIVQKQQKMFQSSQQSISPKKGPQWKDKVDKVIENSKKLITRMRNQSKASIN